MLANHLSWQNCWVSYLLRLLCADFFKILAITKSLRRLISPFLGAAGSYRYSGSGMCLGFEAISIIGTMKAQSFAKSIHSPTSFRSSTAIPSNRHFLKVRRCCQTLLPRLRGLSKTCGPSKASSASSVIMTLSGLEQ